MRLIPLTLNKFVSVLVLSLCFACTEKSTPPNPGRPVSPSDFPQNQVLRIDGAEIQGESSPFSQKYRVRYDGPKKQLEAFVQGWEGGKIVVLGDAGKTKSYESGPANKSHDLGTLKLSLGKFPNQGRLLDTHVQARLSPPKSKEKNWSWELNCPDPGAGGKVTGRFPIDGENPAELEGKPEWIDYYIVSGDDATNVILGAVIFGPDPKLENNDILDRINGAKKAYVFGFRLTDKD